MPDLARFTITLAETVAWCSERASETDLTDSLRTPGLLPASVRERGGLSECRDPSVLASLVKAVAAERSKQLPVRLHCPIIPAEALAGGRLLLIMPDWCLDYGISEWASGGFFDTDDFPPWDTWVWYGDEPSDEEHYLLCWVPPPLLETAHRGVEVSPEPWIFWAKHYRQYMTCDSPLLRELDAAGWLSPSPVPPGEQSP